MAKPNDNPQSGERSLDIDAFTFPTSEPELNLDIYGTGNYPSANITPLLFNNWQENN